MSKENIRLICKNLICDYVDVDPDRLTGEMNLAYDLGLDSFSLMTLMTRLEETFDISIPNDAMMRLSTIGDAEQYIYDALAA